MSFFFVQLADPQFGLFKWLNGRKEDDLEPLWRVGLRIYPTDEIDMSEETRRYTRVIEAINRLRPAFAITCGDLVQDRNDAEQHETLLGLTEMLDDEIPMRWVSGNHDVGVPPTPESIAAYQGRYGPDNYSFDHDGSHFVVINSSVCVDPSGASGRVGSASSTSWRPTSPWRGTRTPTTSCCLRTIRCSWPFSTRPTTC